MTSNSDETVLESVKLADLLRGRSGDMTAPIKVKGVNGQIEFDGRNVIIKRKGFLAFATQGIKGDKAISIKSISAIQFKRAGFFFNGYIQFSFQGGQETKAGIFDATKDENTVMFKKGQARQFEALRHAVETAIHFPTLPQASTPALVADELQKLAELRDRGILTQAEFDRQKEKVLSK